jgi:hypothetical protein
MYYWEGQHLFTIWPNGCVWVVPCPKLQENIMKHAHEELGHFGVCRIYSLFQGQYWWKGMQLQIAKFVLGCMVCDWVFASFNTPTPLLHPY